MFERIENAHSKRGDVQKRVERKARGRGSREELVKKKKNPKLSSDRGRWNAPPCKIECPKDYYQRRPRHRHFDTEGNSCQWITFEWRVPAIGRDRSPRISVIANVYFEESISTDRTRYSCFIFSFFFSFFFLASNELRVEISASCQLLGHRALVIKFFVDFEKIGGGKTGNNLE